jgi:AcrR family transcriptional regulator
MDATAALRRPPFGSNPVVGDRGTKTQRRILSAALEAFAEVGFHGTHVELITKKAGCSRPSFYQYFSSKDDVFWELAAGLGRTMIDQADNLGAITPDAHGVLVLRYWLLDYSVLYEQHAPVFSAFPAARRDHVPFAAGSKVISERLGQSLIRRVEGDHRELGVDSLATGIVTMVTRCNFYWHSRVAPASLSRDQFIDGLARLIHRVLVGPIPGVNASDGQSEIEDTRVRRWPAAKSTPRRALGPSGERTRSRLITAGARVFRSRGYHETRVDDIVKQAGVSHGSFYRYFENKDDLFFVLANLASNQMSGLIDAFPTSSDEEELRRWVEDWFNTYRSNGGVMSMWQEIELVDRRLEAMSQRAMASAYDRLVQLLDRRGLGDPLVAALALLALIERLPYSVFTLAHAQKSAAIDAMVIITRRGLINLDEPRD